MRLIPAKITPAKNTEMKKALNAAMKLSLKVILLMIAGIRIKAMNSANMATIVLTVISVLSSGTGIIVRKYPSVSIAAAVFKTTPEDGFRENLS